MRSSALVALLLVVSSPTGSAAAAEAAQELVPVVEPGKPMRFEVATPPAPQPDAGDDVAEGCLLPAVTERRTTPSSSCTACHDGSKASDARTGHRFGMEYAAARMNPLKGAGLRPDPEAHDANVILQDGIVGCLTCHSPTSRRAFHLAGPTGGPAEQRLCAACHL